MANFRFYTKTPLTIGEVAQLSENAAAHATKALRLGVGDNAIVFNGDGFNYDCELILINKSEVQVKVICAKLTSNESPLQITLLQAISSGDRMDYTIQKAVELGVKNIQPISSQRSVVKLSPERVEKRIEHWQNVAISACEQSGRALVPNIGNPLSLQAWIDNNQDIESTRILLNPAGSTRLEAIPRPKGDIQLLIGAEGGFSPFEINLASKHRFQSVLLGPRILRTETAALAVIACMQTLWGDF